MRVARPAMWWLTRAGLWLPLAASLMTATGAAPAITRHRPQILPDPPRAVFVRMCTGCHSEDRAVGLGRQPRAIWKSLIEQMVMEGAKGSDEDRRVVEQYLVGLYGMVNVNKDGAGEIGLVLDLPVPQAEAIVKYRDINGRFTGLDTLVKVPGVDVKKLEQRRDALIF